VQAGGGAQRAGGGAEVQAGGFGAERTKASAPMSAPADVAGGASEAAQGRRSPAPRQTCLAGSSRSQTRGVRAHG
jgi:hypothetical protein